MEAIAFVIWMIGWPLINDIGDYYTAKEKEITGDHHVKPNEYSSLVSVIIWIWVGTMLYGKISIPAAY